VPVSGAFIPHSRDAVAVTRLVCIHLAVGGSQSPVSGTSLAHQLTVRGSRDAFGVVVIIAPFAKSGI